MLLRGATKLGALGVWLLVGGSAVFWGFQLLVRPAPLPAQAATVPTTQALRGDLTRLLGSAPPEAEPEEPAPVAAASRFRLIGVVAPRGAAPGFGGVALIAVDGKPARAYKVGAAVDGDLVLKAVRARGADLGPRGPGGAALALEIAALPPAATGVPGGAVLPPGVPRPGTSARLAPAIPAEGDPGADDEPGEVVPVAPPPVRQGALTQ